jgi:hypothetical protein
MPKTKLRGVAQLCETLDDLTRFPGEVRTRVVDLEFVPNDTDSVDNVIAEMRRTIDETILEFGNSAAIRKLGVTLMTDYENQIREQVRKSPAHNTN